MVTYISSKQWTQAQSVCVGSLKCHNEYGFYVEPNNNKLATATGDS